MVRVVGVLLVTALLAVSTGCSSSPATRPECSPGRSTLSSIDPATGDISWRADLHQRSELPLEVAHDLVVVRAPCGAAVVSLADGGVRFDDATAGDAVGVADDELFVRDESESGSTPIVGLDLDTDRTTDSFSSNLPLQDAVVADGRLVTMYGDQLSATDPAGTGAAWELQVPAYRQPRLQRSGHLVLVTAGDGSTFAVGGADGTLAWRTVPPVPATAYGLRVSSVPGTVLTAATAATAATTDDEAQRTFVYATDARTGELGWTRPAVGVMGADRHLTVLRTTHAVVAVDTTTGARRWRHSATTLGGVAATALLARRTVVIAQAGSATVALDRSTGRVRWRGPEGSTATTDGDVVAALTPDGLTALDARTGRRLWSEPVDRDRQQVTVATDGRILLLDSDIVPHLGA